MARTSRYAEHRDEVLGMIHAAYAAHSRPPTVRQLAEGVGVGVGTMHSYLQRMAEEGLVSWRPKSHRSLRALQPDTRPPSSSGEALH